MSDSHILTFVIFLVVGLFVSARKSANMNVNGESCLEATCPLTGARMDPPRLVIATCGFGLIDKQCNEFDNNLCSRLSCMSLISAARATSAASFLACVLKVVLLGRVKSVMSPAGRGRPGKSRSQSSCRGGKSKC